jgi:hypothetical protein
MKRTPPDAAPADEATPPGLAHSQPDSSRQEWIEPRVIELPRLNELTLQSGGIPGGGGTGGGGSTVVP